VVVVVVGSSEVERKSGCSFGLVCNLFDDNDDIGEGMKDVTFVIAIATRVTRRKMDMIDDTVCVRLSLSVFFLSLIVAV